MDRFLRFHLTPEAPGDDLLAPVLINIDNLVIADSEGSVVLIKGPGLANSSSYGFEAVYPSGENVETQEFCVYVSQCIEGFDSVSGPIQDAPSPKNFSLLKFDF